MLGEWICYSKCVQASEAFTKGQNECLPNEIISDALSCTACAFVHYSGA
jgi:hypothetical protein